MPDTPQGPAWRASSAPGRPVRAGTEVQQFLQACRARLRPEDVGLHSGPRRLVPGLRREEVASLSGVSVAYYSRLERGTSRNASVEVVDAIARALRLDSDERQYLLDLLRGPDPRTDASEAAGPDEVRPSLARAVERMDAVSAYLRNGRFDVLVANPLARSLFAPLWDEARDRGDRFPNLCSFTASARARTFLTHWEDEVRGTIAAVRVNRGRYPHDRRLAMLAAELRTDPALTDLWHDQDVARWASGSLHVRHPALGEVRLPYDVLEDLAQPGIALVLHGLRADQARALLSGNRTDATP